MTGAYRVSPPMGVKMVLYHLVFRLGKGYRVLFCMEVKRVARYPLASYVTWSVVGGRLDDEFSVRLHCRVALVQRAVSIGVSRGFGNKVFFRRFFCKYPNVVVDLTPIRYSSRRVGNVYCVGSLMSVYFFRGFDGVVSRSCSNILDLSFS